MLSLRALLVTTLLLPFSLLAAQLNGISYNTLQNDEIELRFSLSENISKQPTVKNVNVSGANKNYIRSR